MSSGDRFPFEPTGGNKKHIPFSKWKLLPLPLLACESSKIPVGHVTCTCPSPSLSELGTGPMTTTSFQKPMETSGDFAHLNGLKSMVSIWIGAYRFDKTYTHTCLSIYLVVVLNSLVSKRPFFANRKDTFANLSRIHRRALFIAQVGKSQLLSTDLVREIKSQRFIARVVHDMHFRGSSLKVATFPYQHTKCTSAVPAGKPRSPSLKLQLFSTKLVL